MKRSFLQLIIILWAVAMWSCDPCTDCGQPLLYDPSVKMVFVNQKNANTLQDSINENINSIESNDKLDSALLVDIDRLTKTLSTLDSLIDLGETEWDEDRATTAAELATLEANSQELKDYSDSLNTINSNLNDIIGVIESGNIQLDRVSIVDNDYDTIYEDSMTTYRLPLLLPKNDGDVAETNYRITISGVEYVIGYSYSSEQTIDKSRTVRMQAVNLDTLYKSFDSLKIDCRTNKCISDETTVTAYF